MPVVEDYRMAATKCYIVGDDILNLALKNLVSPKAVDVELAQCIKIHLMGWWNSGSLGEYLTVDDCFVWSYNLSPPFLFLFCH